MINQQDIARIFRDCNTLEHVPIPFDDLVECVIGIDVREKDPKVADTWTEWVYEWLDWGYSEQQVVDIFYALMCAIYSNHKLEGLMTDISTFLENENDGEA